MKKLSTEKDALSTDDLIEFLEAHFADDLYNELEKAKEDNDEKHESFCQGEITMFENVLLFIYNI